MSIDAMYYQMGRQSGELLNQIRSKRAQAAIDQEEEKYIREILTMLDDERKDEAGTLALRCSIDVYLSKIQAMLGKDVLPLPFDDMDVRHDITNAGKLAFINANDWDAVKKVGREYPLPPIPNFLENFCPKAKYDDLIKITNERTDLLNKKTETLDKQDAKVASLMVEAMNLKIEIENLKGQIASITAVANKANAEVDKANAEIDKANDLLNKNSTLINGLAKDCAYHMAREIACRKQLLVLDPENLLAVQSPDGVDFRKRLSERAYEQLIATNNWESVREVGATFMTNEEVQERKRLVDARARE